MIAEENRLANRDYASSGMYPPPNVAEAMADMKRQALDVGFPIPDQLAKRIWEVTRIRRIDASLIVGAIVELALAHSLETHKPIDWSELDVITTLLTLLLSVDGKSRKELVEMARWTKPDSPGRRSFFRR